MTHLYVDTLVIGGTTDGIGRDFINSLRGDSESVRFWAPPPSQLDVTDLESIDKFFERQVRDYGVPHYILYAAGIKDLAFIADTDIDSVKNVFDVNVFGFFNIVKKMQDIAHGGGRICAISSEAAITPMRTSLSYCASKAALNMAIRCAARELGEDWVITGIMPTAVAGTRMTNHDITQIAHLRHLDEEFVMQQMMATGLGRMLQMREVSELIKFLLYRAPNGMTGSVVELRAAK